MKNNKLFLFFYLALLPFVSSAQSGNWVWLKGDNLGGSLGNYGTIGVSSPSNEPPARYQAAYWTDLNGNFWLFGGVGNLNDLWKYNPISNEWTWVKGPTLATSMSGVYGTKGVPSTLNNPPALGYGANCWTDKNGDLWLFSGNDLSGGGLIGNDVLWRYHIATNEWTWMKGDNSLSLDPSYGTLGIASSANTPGFRAECKSAWVYNDKLWLFGGQTNKGNKNDLWSYNIATNNWTWESGTTLDNDLGNYGVKGVSSATNVPPSRWSYTRWQDASNNFYTFAGGISGSQLHNDVWQYNTTTKLWTWVSGTSIINDIGTTNPYCTPNVNNTPGSRYENQSAQTNSACTKAFWTFGGITQDGSLFNDLWLFNTENFEWTKVKGSFGTPPTYSYGTKGVPNTSNLPPGKFGSCVWTDKTGAFFMFGGYGGVLGLNLMNDLWKFIPDTACFHTGLIGGVELTKPTDTVLCLGDTIKIPIPLNCSISVKPSTGMYINTTKGSIEFFGPGTNKYTVIATSLNPNDPCFQNDTITFTISPYPLPKADFTINPLKAYISNPTFNCLNTSTNAVRYEWYYKGALISKSKDIIYSFPAIGKYCLTLVAINKCEQRDSITKCCYVIDTAKLPSIPDTTICFGNTILVNLPIGSSVKFNPSTGYVWDSVNHTVKFSPSVTTKYFVSLIQSIPGAPDLVTDSITFTISIYPLPKAIFVMNPPAASIDSPNFNYANQSTNAVSYEWYYKGQLISTDKDISKTFPELGQYCLTLVAINKCGRDSSTQCCKVYKKGKLVVPNAFTPNGDGKNDGFRPILSGPYLSYSLLVMNRYGQEVFSTEDSKQAWDGTFNGQDEGVGVYYYLIKVKFDYPDAVEEMYKGDISLIR